MHSGNTAARKEILIARLCLINKARQQVIDFEHRATNMETFEFQKTTFRIGPLESEKLSIRVTNVHKAINAELLLLLQRDSTYSVYVPEAQNTHQAAMAIAEILRADANDVFPQKINETGTYLTLLNRIAHEIARSSIMVNWALERMKIPQFQKPEDEL
ncbi:MAG: hypothetical protein JOY96_06440, partial [Verrucomicrobia bacterium]|nr:hypothetical protein [Verrucomicrobiota bacterium]